MNRTVTLLAIAMTLMLSTGVIGSYLAAKAAEPTSPTPPFVVPISVDGVQRTTIILDSYSYSPNHLIVEAGKPVELILSSVTTVTPHNFVLKEPTAGIAVDETIWGGKTATIRFTPTHQGTFTFYCDKRLWPLPSHRDKGMEGKLEVR